MEAVIALDTHVAVWLHAGELGLIPPRVRERLEQEELGISPIVLLEMEYLRETKRITISAEALHADLERDIGLQLLKEPFHKVVRESLSQTWTRDPIDRLICAHALIGQYPLATKDRFLRRHCPVAFWG